MRPAGSPVAPDRAPDEGPSPNVDTLGSGTGLRFVLLVVLVVTSTVAMMSDHIVLHRFLGDPNNDIGGCMMAAGVDPGGTLSANLAATARNRAALDACSELFTPPWWAVPALLVAVFALAAGLCWLMPIWKVRRRGLRPVDPSSDTGRALADLADRAGLASAHFVADWASGSVNAVAFGRPGRTWISLPAGLLLSRTTHPDRFVAIVLHELAHLRSRDVAYTYSTIALWRVFAPAILLPYVAFHVELLVRRQFFLTGSPSEVYLTVEGPDYARAVASALFTALLVYLTRSDILRTRELYADRFALEKGAAIRVWENAASARRARRRISTLLSALFGTHPSWRRRHRALHDSEMLLRVPPVPTFLTGAAAALITTNLGYVPGWGGSHHGLGSALAGALIAATTCLTLWRRAALAVPAGRPAPSGVGAGLWLGAGLAVGNLLITVPPVEGQWFPTASWVTVLLGLLAFVVTCWTAQCARLLITAVPARWVRVVAAVGLLGTAGGIAVWLNWVQATAGVFLPDMFAIVRGLAGEVVDATGAAASVASSMLTIAVTTVGELGPPLAWSAAVILLVPSIAWLGPAHGPRAHPGGVPSFPRVLAAAALGAVVSTALAVGVVRLPLDDPSGTLLTGGLVATLLVGPLAAAMVAAALDRTGTAVPVGAVVAGLGVLIAGLTAPVALAQHGCVAAIIGTRSCLGFAVQYVGGTVLPFLTPTVFVAAALALFASWIAAGLRRLRGTRAAGTPAPEPARRSPAAARIRRALVGVIMVLAVGQAAITSTSTLLSSPAGTTDSVPSGTSAQPASSPQVRNAQITAWLRYGGLDLILEFAHALSRTVDDGRLGSMDLEAGLAATRAGCVGLDQWVADARAYFLVPDPDLQERWAQVQSAVARTSAACLAALDARDDQALLAVLEQVEEVGRQADSVVVDLGR